MKELWSPRAQSQLHAICRYIADDSEANAELIAQRIFDSIDLLKTQPEMGRAGRVLGTRELVVPRTPYLIVYRLVDGAIEVIAILHGKQDHR